MVAHLGANRQDSDAVFAGKQLPLSALLYLATAGGASVCGLEKTIGQLRPGMEFDAILVSSGPANQPPAVWGSVSERDLLKQLEQFFMCGDDRNIQAVWVRNRLVGGVFK